MFRDNIVFQSLLMKKFKNDILCLLDKYMYNQKSCGNKGFLKIKFDQSFSDFFYLGFSLILGS